MRSLYRIRAVAFAAILMPFSVALAESAATTVRRADVSTSFARYERAWAAYQLAATAHQYDIGDVVTAATAPTTEAGLFTAYRFAPAPSERRTIHATPEPTNADGSRVRLCLSATLSTAADLDGFLQGLKKAGASLATPSCQAGVLSAGFTYPVQLHAYKTVRAMRAVSFIERDKAERAAQVAVADTITFALPEGKLLDMATQPGSTSSDFTVVLQNSSEIPWAIGSATVAAPFSATVAGCENVLPGMTCTLAVSFSPVAAGRFMDFVSVVPVAGKSLSIRVGGTATAAP